MHFGTVLIIGGVAAGTKTAAKTKRENPDFRVVVLTREKHVSYAGCGLPYYIGDVIREEKELVVRKPEDFRTDNDIEIVTGFEAVNILPEAKKVVARDVSSSEESEFSYDKLVLATGASPFIPPVPGAGLKKIYTVRTVSETLKMKELISSGGVKSAVVVGGGLIGLEMAENLSHRGIKTTVVELAGQVLPPYDYEVALHVENHLREKGVEVITGTAITGFKDNGLGGVSAVLTEKGSIGADMVVLAVGVRPNVELARKCGIALGSTGAIKVNDKMETNLKDVYAVGDCAENLNLITGHSCWYPMGSTANKTGRVAGQNLSGPGQDSMPGVLGTSIVKVFDMHVAKTGLSEKEAEALAYDVETVLVPAKDRAHYFPGNREIITKLIVDRGSRRVLGGQIFGEGVVDKPVDILATAISFGATVDQLAKLDLAYAPPFSSAMSTTIVSANVMINKLAGKFIGVSPGDLLKKKEEGAVFLDVREPEEFFLRAIPDSVNIPLKKLAGHADELAKEKEIVVICKVGLRSYAANLRLKKMGFNRVGILEGGICAYPYETE
ncbi:MAG: dehydrogenase [Peptococcaceae bacterium BRH_c4b]|nr:MAG: dehydrogenase [Peptococcaceae bacterium BRH_c4b]